MKTIIVSGTPGTGKTFLSKAIAKKLKFEYIDVNNIISKHKLKEKYDKKRQTYIINIGKLNKALINLINEKQNEKDKAKQLKGLVIDSHLAHHLLKKYVDLVIITKCDIKKLNKRLIKRKYSKTKVRENLEAEIFDVCAIEAKELGHNVLIVDTTKRIINKDIESIVKKIKTLLKLNNKKIKK